MNNKRRAIIRKAIQKAHDAYDLIDMAYEEEAECLSNLPDTFEGSSKYESMENYTELLEEARDQLEYACEAVDQILS